MVMEAKSVNAASITTYNPATGEALAELACAGRDDVRRAVQRAKDAQPRWHATPVAQRVAVLRSELLG